MNPISTFAAVKNRRSRLIQNTMNMQRINLRVAPRGAGVILLVVAVALMGSAHRGLAQAGPNPPERMTYQGFLTDGSGTPLGNAAPKNYDIIFRIWKSESSTAAGDRLWTEQQTVTVDKGYFSVMLGEGGNIGESKPALSTLFTGADASDRWVSTTVKGIGAGGADVNILPRLRLLTAPYTYLATRAVSVDGTSINSGTLPDARLSSNVARRDVANTFAAAQTVNNTLTVNGNQTVTGAASANSVSATTVSATTVTATTFTGGGTIPLGGIIMWSGATPPNGWALCNGQTLNGQVTPDLRGRFVLGSGAGTGLTVRTLGQTGGVETVTLTLNEIPAHTHTVDPPSTATTSNGSHTHSFTLGRDDSGDRNVAADGDVSGGQTTGTTASAGAHTHTMDIAQFNSGSAGSGQAHQNMPPFYVLAFIMRVQ